MSDLTNPPQCQTADLKRVFYANQHWSHILPPGVDWREPLHASYWAKQLTKFSPGDLITVSDADYTLSYQLLVCQVQDIAGYLRMQSRPLFPHDLDVPAVIHTAERPRYGVQASRHGGGLFCVADLQTGEIVRDQLNRIAANDLAFERNAANQAAKTDLAVLSAATEIAAGMERHKAGARK